jgi:chromosome segregation ATPase
MKFFKSFFTSTMWMLCVIPVLVVLFGCTDTSWVPQMTEDLKQAEQLQSSYSNLTESFRGMSQKIKLIESAYPKQLIAFGDTSSLISDYSEKTTVYQREIEAIGRRFSDIKKGVEEGVLNADQAKEEYKTLKNQLVHIEKGLPALKKELEGLTLPYERFLRTLPENGKELLLYKDISNNSKQETKSDQTKK